MFADPTFLWALLGLILIGSEFILPGFIIFFFGAGALITALLSVIFPGIDSRFVLQVIIWIAASGLSLSTLRKHFAKIFKGNLLPGRQDSSVGKTAEVIEKISPEQPGRIKFQGTSWKAISYTETIEAGEEVSIIEQDNLTFSVTKSLTSIDE
jgi:inner membrane protein